MQFLQCDVLKKTGIPREMKLVRKLKKIRRQNYCLQLQLEFLWLADIAEAVNLEFENDFDVH
jgi:hypothetical protein